MSEKPSEAKVREFCRTYGPMASKLAEILHKISPEVKMLTETKVGWELVEEDVERWKVLAVKVLANNATEPERQECKYLTFERIPHVANRIATYFKALGIIGTGDSRT